MHDTSGRLGEVARRLTAPFGARRLTAAQIAAQADAGRQQAGVVAEKWRVLHDLTAARLRYGLSAQNLTVLEALLTFLPETVLAPDPEAGIDLTVFPSNRSLSARARGLSEASLRRHLSALVEAGLVIRRDSPNGKRYSRRGEGGMLTHAFGFDLTPLAYRAEEIAGLAEAVRAEALALSLARENVSLLRRDCAKLLDAVDAHVADGVIEEASAESWRARFRALLAAYPRRPEPADVTALAEALETLALTVSAALTACEEPKKTSGTAAHSERHIQSSKPDVPDYEPASRGVQKPASAPDPVIAVPTFPDGAIRSTYPLSSVLEACPQIRDYTRGGIRSWSELIEAATRLRSMLGISASAWNEAREAMGEDAAAVTFAAILEKQDRIKSPGGYLRTLTERKRAGTYSLGPVLQALRRTRLQPSERLT